MSLSIFSTVVLVLCLTCIFSSCRDERKEKYLQEVEKTLDREIKWINERIENTSWVIHNIYHHEHKPLAMKKYFLMGEIAMNRYNNTKDSLVSVYGKSSNLVDKLSYKALILDEAIVCYTELKKSREELRALKTDNSDRYSHNFVCSSPEKVILHRNEKFKAKLYCCGFPYIDLQSKLDAKVENRSIYPNENGFFEYSISGDSTCNMKPGKYSWRGEIRWRMHEKDSIFQLYDEYVIIPAL